MTLTRRSFITLAVASFATSLAMPAFATTEPRWYSKGDNLVAGGRDVVAYFSLDSGDGVLGSDAFMAEHKGSVFHFSNAESLATF